MSQINSFENIKPFLRLSVSQTFGDIAFIDVYEAQEDSYTHQKEDTILCVEVMSPFQGSINLFIPQALKVKIAENIFAESYQNIEEKDVDDSLLEILNVICGDFLGDYFDNTHDKKIGLPGVVFDIPDRNTGYSQWVCFDAEGIRFGIMVRQDMP